VRRNPRRRRQVGRFTARLSRLVGFRYDAPRDAYVLRLVGNRFGPVLRTHAPVDSAAATIGWSEEMEEIAERRRTGRFKREPQPAEADAEATEADAGAAPRTR